MDTQNQPVNIDQVPILIYVPGMGGADANSADRLAEVVAQVADTLDAEARFGTQTTMGVTAPRGLSVGKTIVDESDKPRLQLFQFDYASVLEVSRSTALPDVAPGMVRSTVIAVWAFMKWFPAFGRKAKTARTKAQLLLGLGAALALIVAALMTLYALLVALGVDLPWLEGVLGTEAAPWTFGVASLGLTVTWAALRKKILGLADAAERFIRFTNNNDQTADTISFHLDHAIDQLRGTGWKGPLHLLGYSFGSLVLFEAMYPRVNAHLPTQPVESVSSLVTIGCPLDLVRLYEPTFDKLRQERKENLRWTNVFNEADIFASNLRNGDDHSEGVTPFTIGTAQPNSIRYTNETIGFFQIFLNGRTHSSYWGSPHEANCFARLVPEWLAVPQVPVGGDGQDSAGAS